MRITLKMDELVPAGAIYRGMDHAGRAVVEVTDPTPPAPKIIMFVADGEPRVSRNGATYWLRTDNILQHRFTDDDFSDPRQHYRQLPVEDTLTKYDLEMCRMWGQLWTRGCETYEKLRRIIVAMESKEKQC